MDLLGEALSRKPLALSRWRTAVYASESGASHVEHIEQDPFPPVDWLGMAGRSYKTGVVLRSIRFGEADQVLHLYTQGGADQAVARASEDEISFRRTADRSSRAPCSTRLGRPPTVTGVDLVSRAGPRATTTTG